MFTVKTRIKCHCCPNEIDCRESTERETVLNQFITKEDHIRYLCDDCYEIIEIFDDIWIDLNFESQEDYIRHVRKEQERVK